MELWLDPFLVATAAVAFLLAGCIKGMIGLGLPMVAVAILGSFISLREAIPLIVIPVLLTNTWQVLQGGELMALFRRFWPLNLTMCVGIWIGTALLFRIDPLILSAVLGVIVIGNSLVNLFAVRVRVPRRSERMLGPPVGLVVGVLTGTTGSVGASLAMYMQALDLRKEAFLQAISLSFLIGGVIWITALINQGALDTRTALLSIAALVPSFAGMWLGQVVRNQLSEDRFRTGVFIFLALIGLNLIRKGLS